MRLRQQWQKDPKYYFLLMLSSRNVDPRVSRIDNVFLYNMDDVSEIANENLKSRIAEVDRCRLTLSKKAIRLWSQMCSQPVNPDSSSNQSAPSL